MKHNPMICSLHRKLFGFFTMFVLLLSSFSYAERMYVTFMAPDGGSLQKSDLTLKLDKKDLPISEFLTVNSMSPAPEVAKHPAGRRQYVLLYDLVFAKPEDVVAARKTSEAFLKDLPATDLVAVASISKKHGLQFHSGFTSDRQKIIGGMNMVGLEQVQGVVAGPEGNYYKAQFKSAPVNQVIPEDQFLNVIKKAEVIEEKKDQQWPGMFIQALTDLAYTLSIVDGKKDVVLFSPGFETEGVKMKVSEKGFTDSYVDRVITDETYMETSEEQRGREAEERKADREPKNELAPVQVEGIPEFVSAASCSMHIVTPGGQKYDFYKNLANQTGGSYLDQTSDPTQIVKQVLDSDPQFYVIGFDGKTETQFKALHRLNLEASGKKLVAPAVWIAPPPYSQYTPLMKRLHVSEAVYKDYEKPTSGYRFWSDFVYDQGALKIPIFAQISGPEILKQDVQEYSLEFYGFAMDANGTLIDYTYVPVRLDLKNKNVRDRLGKSGVKIWGVLLGQKGPVTVRTVLINREFGDTYTSTTKLDIPDSELTTSNPFFPDLNLDWMVLPSPQEAQTKRGVTIHYPYAMAENQFFFPNLDPKIKLGEKGRVVYFRMYHLLPESKNPPIKLGFLNPQGQRAEVEQFGLLQKPRILEQGGMELFWKLVELPGGISKGPCQFVLQLKDPVNNKEINRAIPMEIQ